MKRFLVCLVCLALIKYGNATITVHMYSTPVVLDTSNVPVYHYLDAQNDGIDDARIGVIYDFSRYYVIFQSINNQGIEVEIINSDEGIAYNCGASMGAGTDWKDTELWHDITLAKELDDAQFDGRGPRYLAVRKQINISDQVYGWIKLACSQDGK